MKITLRRSLALATLVSVPPNAQSILDELRSAADASSCAAIVHPGRGKAPKALLRGMALTYARTYCRIKESKPVSPKEPGTYLSKATNKNAAKDVAEFYRTELTN